MPRKPRRPSAQKSFLQIDTKTAPCVPQIREEVSAWAATGYKGVTKTTRTLLNHWFHTDHRLPSGRKFQYHPFQREALETLIYIYEVAKKRSHKDLIESYARVANLRLLQYDLFPRYALKMATGTGKTKVIALAVAWQYFNAILEDPAGYAATHLLIAPNVIVFERLKTDFAGGRVFKSDPIIPSSLQIYWDFDCYIRGEGERASSQGALYLTNIQQLYERDENPNGDEVPIMSLMLGNKPPAQPAPVEPFDTRLLKRGGPIFVVNDEAHHTHAEDSEWNKAIRRLHESLLLPSPTGRGAGGEGQGEGGDGGEGQREGGGRGLIQLDMSATPRYTSGALFTWTIFDYPLKQAIIDNVVKRPLKGVARGLGETPSDIASVRYQTYLAAGVNRWKEYRDKLAPVSRKPVLFVMLNSTKEADDVADYLRVKYPAEFAGDKLHVIHTNLKGDVSTRDESEAREIAKDIDEPGNPVNCIVSVLMLREGWDVQSVTVVVGLRPYSSKANILPEQTIGRGLRLMFRDSNSYREQLDVIGNKAFLEFVEQLEKDEDLEFDTVDLDHQPVIIETIHPDPAKADKDIVIPILSPTLTRKKNLAEEIAGIDVSRLKVPTLPKKQGDKAAQTFTYEGYDIITLEKLIEREYTIPEVGTSQEVISYYAKRIASDLKLPSQFAALVPKIREFLQDYAFGEKVDLDDAAMIKAIAHPVAQHVTVKAFTALLREVVVQELTPLLENPGKPLSTCEPFPWSRETLEASKTIFNLAAADNQFELAFARFLQGAGDVERFAKLPEQFGFTIPYTDSVANLRYYEPDFIAVTADGIYHLIETKGREDVDVPHKDRAAALWCENATLLTGTAWQYLKVPQKEFEKLRPDDFSDLIALTPVQLL
jgi:type III restriction enzyme